MPRKSFKNSKHLVELIESCRPAALPWLAAAEGFELLSRLAWDPPGPDLRNAALALIAELPPEHAGKLDQEAVRLLQLSHWRCDELLTFATATAAFAGRDPAEFDGQADPLTQLIWFFAHLPAVFEQLETIYLAHHYHGHKKFKPFKVRDGNHRPLVWTEEIARKLQDQVGAILALDETVRDSCEVIHFEMEEAGNDPAAPGKRLHYVVVYHPGKMKLLRQMKDRRRDLLAFYPALEATLVYDPAENRIMVLADKLATRVALAEGLAEIGLDLPLSAEPLEQMSYDLAVLRSPVDLTAPPVPGALIEQGWVAGMTVSLGRTPHQIAVTLGSDADFWRVLQDEFGATNPLSRAGFLFEVRLSFVVRFDGQSTSKALDIAVTPKTCSLWSLADRQLRACGEDILLALGIMQRAVPETAAASQPELLAEFSLLDEPQAVVDGFRLRALGLEARSWEVRGTLRKRAWAKVITLLRDDADEAEPVFHRLAVQSDSRESWALDPLTRQRINLSEGDLCSYTLNRAWLQERLTARVSAQLSSVPTHADVREPYFLGCYRCGDQDIPVHLVTRLWQDQHAEVMDVEIRKQNLGLGVVLTTTDRRYRTFLGSSLVISLASLIDEGPDGAAIDLRRIEPEFRRWRGLAATANEPRLIKETGGAVLVGPWPEPWMLSKPEQIASVAVLVKAWQSKHRRCSTEQVLAGYAGARTVPERFRGDPRWTLYIRGADGHKRCRYWELRIGQSEPVVAD